MSHERHAFEPVASQRSIEELTRMLVDTVRDYAIFLLSPDGRVQSWNAGAAAIKGYSAAEIVGESFTRFYTSADLEAGTPWRLLRAAREQGRVEEEGWRVRKDGSRFWADVVITALRDERGTLEGFAKVTRDLTERKQQDERLRASEERFRLLVDSLNEYAIFMLDPAGNIVTWNSGAERIKGYTAQEILGRHFSIFYTEVDAERANRELAIAADEGVFKEEGYRLRKDGTKFWANVVLTALHNDSGELVGYAKVTRDLTDRRRLDEERLRLAQAEEAVRLRDEFLSIASHELRTPLAAMQLQLEDLRVKLQGAGDTRVLQRIDRATRSGEKLAELTETLLDVSRISTGRMELHRDRMDLGELLAAVEERVGVLAKNAGSKLQIHSEPGLVGSWDRLRVEQVVINLLSNAAKFGAGAPISVTATREGNEAVLRVCDKGPGVPAADIERIFGRFERATPIRHHGGFGLGLYVTQEIVRGHGGSVSAANQPEGGACFTVRLPLAAEAHDCREVS